MAFKVDQEDVWVEQRAKLLWAMFAMLIGFPLCHDPSYPIHYVRIHKYKYDLAYSPRSCAEASNICRYLTETTKLKKQYSGQY